MAGLDLSVKMRRGLGNGKVVPSEELAERLRKFDGDRDGSLSLDELTEFLVQSQIGGPWFCKMIANALWRTAEERWLRSVKSISADALGRIINYTMALPPRPEKRYVITADAMHGLAPKVPVKEAGARPAPEGRSPSVTQPSAAAPRAGAPSPRPGPSAASPPRPGGRPAPRPMPAARPSRPGPKPRR